MGRVGELPKGINRKCACFDCFIDWTEGHLVDSSFLLSSQVFLVSKDQFYPHKGMMGRERERPSKEFLRLGEIGESRFESCFPSVHRQTFLGDINSREGELPHDRLLVIRICWPAESSWSLCAFALSATISKLTCCCFCWSSWRCSFKKASSGDDIVGSFVVGFWAVVNVGLWGNLWPFQFWRNQPKRDW